MHPSTSSRLAAIDGLRALTMLLMIWVNDFWTLSHIPVWLGHAAAQDDAMGLSDVVFPAFLFIVGLSLPFAVDARRQRGDGAWTLSGHVLSRSVALLLMGVCHVNLETYADTLAWLPKPVWQVGITLAFFLIWLDYPADWSARWRRGLQAGGWVLLAVLAALYRGGTVSEPSWLTPQWWGILGLIGWAYLSAGLLLIALGERLWALLVSWLALMLFGIGVHAGYLAWLEPLRTWVWPAENGAMAAIAMAGVCTVVLYRQHHACGRTVRSLGVLLLAAAVLLALGLALRPLGGLSKIRATPAWVLVCTGISMLAFAALAWLMDVRQRRDWLQPLRPAGTSTLTCYLLPYLLYPLLIATGLALPDWLLRGGVGLLKSMLFALAVVWLTGLLARYRLRLRL
ncbi:DUF5009 domain-containing protein [Chitinimonas sp. BJYL2]|uniref:DUF5009 domain-containing protein n=1 Tax=Chitinimonas sp. BJYL2 TaxID=2976696 RepID=UPI0022B46921|nr:DUF5009 domain-containing protein [Chitinimonas sp. BJYL2]